MEKDSKIVKYGLYLTMFLPLLFLPFTFFPWHYGKTVIFQIIVEALFLLYFVRVRRSYSVASTAKSLNYLDWSILAFLAIITVTALTGVNSVNSFWGNQARANGVVVWWHFGVYYFLLKNYLQKLEGQKYFCQILIILSVCVAIAVSLSSVFPQLLPASWQSLSGGGIIGNRAFLASYLVLAVGLSLYCFTIFKSNWRWSFVVSTIFLAYVLFLTGNRGAFFGLLFGLFVGIIVFIFTVTNRKIKIGLTIFLLCFLFFIFYFLFSQQGQFIDSLTSGTGETRLMAWNIAWQGIKVKPIVGWGWGNFDVVFDKFYNPNFLKYSFVETVWDKPHNWFLEIIVTGGVFGALAYFVILIFAWYYLLKSKNVILFATLSAGFAASLFLFETSNSLILWFLILAIASSSCHCDVATGDRSNPVDIGKNRISTAFGLVTVFLFVSYFLFFNFYSLRYSYYIRQAELSTILMDWVRWSSSALSAPDPFKWENAIFLAQRFVQFDKAGAMIDKKEIKELALDITSTLNQAGERYPLSLAYPVWSGQVYTVLGEKFDKKYYNNAESVLNNALKISPRKQEVHFLLGRLYLLQQNFPKALDEQRLAVELASGINFAHWFYGLTLVASGDRQAGLVEIEKALELGYALTVDQKLYMLDLYAEEKNYLKLIEEYKKLIEAEPYDVNWYIKLATVYAVYGDKKLALDLAQQILSQVPQLKNEVDNFIKEYKLK